MIASNQWSFLTSNQLLNRKDVVRLVSAFLAAAHMRSILKQEKNVHDQWNQIEYDRPKTTNARSPMVSIYYQLQNKI